MILLQLSLFPAFSKTGKVQKRGKINLIGRLQLSTEKSKEEDNEGIMQLRILRVQVGSISAQLHRPGLKVIKLFSYSTQLSMKLQLLIKTEIPTNEEVYCFESLSCCMYVQLMAF